MHLPLEKGSSDTPEKVMWYNELFMPKVAICCKCQMIMAYLSALKLTGQQWVVLLLAAANFVGHLQVNKIT